jgi:hypothetical protein
VHAERRCLWAFLSSASGRSALLALRLVYHLMRFGEAYAKQTEQQYAEQVRQRLEKQLEWRAWDLGYELRKIEAGPAAPQG